MKTFKEFILEDRLRSPSEILQRAARRYGPHIKGKVKDSEWGELDKSKLIPLKKYDADLADEAFDKYMELPDNFPKHKNVSVSIVSLYPGQEYVNFSDPNKLQNKLNSDVGNRILIVKHNNKEIVLDGHHTIYTKWAKGQNTITPHEYVDMDGYNPKK